MWVLPPRDSDFGASTELLPLNAYELQPGPHKPRILLLRIRTREDRNCW